MEDELFLPTSYKPTEHFTPGCFLHCCVCGVSSVWSFLPSFHCQQMSWLQSNPVDFLCYQIQSMRWLS